MSEKKVLFHALMLGLVVLTISFLLLFNYVDMKWWDLKSIAIHPIHTVVATVVMIAIGLGVYIVRNRRS